MFSTTGDNLNILICTEYSPHNDWMTFLSWYSAHKFLPSANIAISCTRTKNTQCLFHWTARCKVKCFKHRNSGFAECIKTAINNQVTSTPLIAISSQIITVKELSHQCINYLENTNIVSSNNKMVWFLKENKINDDAPQIDDFDFSFASHDCLSKFNLTEWCKNKQSHPFGLFWKFYHENLTTNEATILNLWKKIQPLYENFNHCELS